MGLLADIFSTADTAKRRLSGLLADPLGTLALGVTRFGEDQGGLLNMTQNAYPMAGNKTVLNSPQQIANFRQQVADKGAEMAMQAATVWHGSPHKFDKFDSSKIGSGEGSQAYGHGLYVADNPTVANSYKAMAGNPARRQFGLNAEGDAQVTADAMIKLNAKQYTGGDVAKLADLIQRRPEAFKDPEVLVKRISEYEGNSPPSFMYKVDLPDEHIAKMLDWDKPLSQQPANIQSWLKDAYNPYRKQLTALDVGGNEPTGGLVMNRLQQLMSEGKKADVFTNAANYGAANASREIADYGIPGIRYLDGGSRGTGAGTSNFVVFPGNEGLLQILERNGQALK